MDKLYYITYTAKFLLWARKFTVPFTSDSYNNVILQFNDIHKDTQNIIHRTIIDIVEVPIGKLVLDKSNDLYYNSEVDE